MCLLRPPAAATQSTAKRVQLVVDTAGCSASVEEMIPKDSAATCEATALPIRSDSGSSLSSPSTSVDTHSTEASRRGRRPQIEEPSKNGLEELRAVHARCTRRWRQHTRSPSLGGCQRPRQSCVSKADQLFARVDASAKQEIDKESSTEGASSSSDKGQVIDKESSPEGAEVNSHDEQEIESCAHAEHEIDKKSSTQGWMCQDLEHWASSKAEVERLLGEMAALDAQLLQTEAPSVQREREQPVEVRNGLPPGVGIAVAAAAFACVAAALQLRTARLM